MYKRENENQYILRITFLLHILCACVGEMGKRSVLHGCHFWKKHRNDIKKLIDTKQILPECFTLLMLIKK